MLYCLYMFVCVSPQCFCWLNSFSAKNVARHHDQLCRQSALVHQSRLRLWLHLTLLNGSSIQDLSPLVLSSLPSKTRRSHLKGHNLSAVGIKLIMANRLYQFLHPVMPPASDPSQCLGIQLHQQSCCSSLRVPWVTLCMLYCLYTYVCVHILAVFC